MTSTAVQWNVPLVKNHQGNILIKDHLITKTNQFHFPQISTSSHSEYDSKKSQDSYITRAQKTLRKWVQPLHCPDGKTEAGLALFSCFRHCRYPYYSLCLPAGNSCTNSDIFPLLRAWDRQTGRVWELTPPMRTCPTNKRPEFVVKTLLSSLSGTT